jgi:hypothetical protein
LATVFQRKKPAVVTATEQCERATLGRPLLQNGASTPHVLQNTFARNGNSRNYCVKKSKRQKEKKKMHKPHLLEIGSCEEIYIPLPQSTANA